MNTKPFSDDLCEENDFIAKMTACEYFESLEYELLEPISDQEEVYKDWDFIMYYCDKPVTFEVERKLSWMKSAEWQGYPTVDVAYRKRDSKADFFVMSNYHNDTLAITKMSNVLSSLVKNKNTIYTKNEPFFKCNISIFKFVYRENGRWKKIN